MATKNTTSIIPKPVKDNFRNFKGFAPEGRYESFLRETPAEVATSILKANRGKTVDIEWYPVGKFGVAEKSLYMFLIPEKDGAIDVLLNGVNTDYVRILFREDIEGYVLQRIVNRDQSITQIERLW